MVLYLFPGIRPGSLRVSVDAGAEGIVLLGFGSGNVPLEGWPEAIAEATEAGVPVVVRSQCLVGASSLTRYKGGAEAAKAGALCARDMTIETAIVRTMFLLAQAGDLAGFWDAWEQPIAGEMTV
jgi:L-asparaginase